MKNGLEVGISPRCRRCQFDAPPPAMRSLRPPLLLSPFGFTGNGHNFPKSGLESRSSGGPIHRRPLSDDLGSEVCHSPPTDLASDRWDSPGNAPVAGDSKGWNGFLVELGADFGFEMSFNWEGWS